MFYWIFNAVVGFSMTYGKTALPTGTRPPEIARRTAGGSPTRRSEGVKIRPPGYGSLDSR